MSLVQPLQIRSLSKFCETLRRERDVQVRVIQVTMEERRVLTIRQERERKYRVIERVYMNKNNKRKKMAGKQQ